MKRTALLLAVTLTFAGCSTDNGNRIEFEQFKIEGLESAPDFWKVRPAEITELCRNVTKGHSEVIAETPYGYPVYAVFYGDFTEDAPQTNWSAGNSSNTIMSYLGDRFKEESPKQTIMFLAGVHGAEPEGVAAAMNMIQMLETGKDFRGQTDSEFLELATKYRLIIIPCANMDGRSLCPDHLRGQPYEVFRAACQGNWLDGSLVGWRGSKEHFPLPLDKVSFPGGYPNGNGYNIQHDVTPGDMHTEEAKAICRLLARWRVDMMLNVHSCEYQSRLLEPSLVDTPRHINRALSLYEKANTALLEAGLRVSPAEPAKPGDETINLTFVANWCSGALGMTLECTSSFDDINNPTVCFSFDQLMEPPFTVMKVIMKDGLERPLAERITNK